MNKQNTITTIFQNLVKDKDIREFKKSLIYFIFFRIIRNFLNDCIEIKIFNFKILASNKKNKTSHALLKKCDFDDQDELKMLNKFSKLNKIFLLDCGCNYGFYSFYVASISNNNLVLSIEASSNTSIDFKKNLELNKFKNIIFKNIAISDQTGQLVTLNESINDWESSIIHNKFEKKNSSSIKTININNLLKNYELNGYTLFIKLDVEGFEFNAINGGLDIINKYHPIIIVELSKYILQNKNFNFSYLQDFLNKFDYAIYDTDHNKIDYSKILELINNLDFNHKTIGNFYLLKNSSYNEKIFKND